jgi:copper transport protein
MSRRTRLVAILLVAFAAVTFVWRRAEAHAALVSSEPAAGSRLTTPPARLRLVFSEPIEAPLSHIALVGPEGSTPLTVASDPRDVHALVTPLDSLRDGSYRVEWHIVSADGHPVSGAFAFSVGAAAVAPIDTNAVTTPPSRSAFDEVPLLAASLRGLGVGCVMAAFGMLCMAMWTGAVPGAAARRALAGSTVLGALLLTAHLLAWLMHVAPDGRLTGELITAVSSTLSGQVEIARVLLAIAVLWALWLAQRPSLAVAFAAMTLVASASVGHAAVFHAAISIPLKAIHLIAAGIWLGGLLWLALHASEAPERVASDAPRISAAALASVLAVVATGIVQTLLIVPSPLNGLRSVYGAVIGAKVLGLLILVAFGAYHRQRVLPRIADGAADTAVAGFRRSLRAEIVVFAIVILLGGLVAYIPPSATPPG